LIVTIFRSRLLPDCQPEYDEFVDLTAERVEEAAGFKSHKLFVAEDGERLTLVEFESEEAQRAWNRSREHVDARKAGRARFYSEYTIQICEVLRESSFRAK
jgi:heme-degrading monooxygenase HmoA